MRSYHALSEAAAGARYLAYYRIHEHNEAEQQLLRRLIWLLFAGAWYVEALGVDDRDASVKANQTWGS
jgi:hypothetical protein